MSVATAYYRKADGVIMVFDVTNEKSFVNIQSRWMDAIMSEDWLVNFLCNVLKIVIFCDTKIAQTILSYTSIRVWKCLKAFLLLI